MPRNRYYVGHKQGSREVFQSKYTPSADSHPQYSGAVGPFRTKRGALWASQYGAWYYSISEAERYAKAELK